MIPSVAPVTPLRSVTRKAFSLSRAMPTGSTSGEPVAYWIFAPALSVTLMRKTIAAGDSKPTSVTNSRSVRAEGDAPGVG